jgi:hypothetical protein
VIDAALGGIRAGGRSGTGPEELESGSMSS